MAVHVARLSQEAGDALMSWLPDAYPDLRRFAGAIGSIDDDPDDIVQEALARLLEHEVPPDKPEQFVRAVIVNVAVDRIRRTQRWRVRLPLLAAATQRHDTYPSDLALLDQLSPRARALLWLVDVVGWSYADASGLLGMGEATARKTAERARRRLRKLLMELRT